MLKLTPSLRQWLWLYHRDKIAIICFGHTELFTPEMKQDYLAWCLTDEGRSYLKGGSEYRDEVKSDE